MTAIENLSLPTLAFGITLLSYLGYQITSWYRRYAIAKGVLDRPNQRSSHSVSTPLGGGISIVILSLLVFAIALPLNLLDAKTSAALIISGTIIAFIGFLDDHQHINSALRLLIHLLATLIGVAALPALPALDFFHHQIELDTTIGIALSALALTWILNLYNFMDGIDGIASVEALTVLIGAAFISLFSAPSQAELALLLTGPVIGFLIWNWAPAKIFMGDGGSGFLGVILGLLALHFAANSSLNLWCWAILLGVFIVDANWTLVTRFRTRQVWHQAHRSHAYQILARKYTSHTKVSVGCGLVNLFWLTPFALAASLKPTLGPIFTLFAYLPLALLCWRSGAGLHK